MEPIAPQELPEPEGVGVEVEVDLQEVVVEVMVEEVEEVEVRTETALVRMPAVVEAEGSQTPSNPIRSNSFFSTFLIS